MLQQALERALAGQGGFRMLDRGRPVLPPASAPVAKGLVLWPLASTPDDVWQLLAAMAAGCVPVLLPDTLPAARIAELRQRYPGCGLREGDRIEAPTRPSPADLCMGLLTSGSTGEPKLIVTTAARLNAGAQAIAAAQQLQDQASSAVLLPLAYSFAFVNQLVWALLNERTLSFPGPLADLAHCLQRVDEEGIAMLCLVPQQARALARLADEGVQLPRVQRLNFAGAPFPIADFDALRRLFPNARIFNNYGCAEAMPRLSCREVKAADEDLSRVGPPIGDLELRIRDIEAGPAIEFRGSSSALGLIAPDGTLQPFPEWIASGDLGRLDAQGLQVLGRHDQVIKIGGERFSLAPVEAALLACGATQVLAWAEAGEDRQPVRVLVEMAAAPELQPLLKQLRERLPRALLPGAIWWTDRWALNANQKTDRPRLMAQAREGAFPRIWPS